MLSPQKCIPKIEEQTSPKVFVDGLRSLFEADIFKEHFTKFTLIAVHAPPEVRFNRLSIRGRSDDPPNWMVFHERDMRELGVGLGNTIAMAETIVINNNSMEQFKVQVKDNLGRIERKMVEVTVFVEAEIYPTEKRRQSQGRCKQRFNRRRNNSQALHKR